jgi:hypothetical protein
MNLFPFDALGAQTRSTLWAVITNNGDWIPRFVFMLPFTFTHDKQTAAQAWAQENNMNLFISVTLRMAIFEKEDDATIFKLAWM